MINRINGSQWEKGTIYFKKEAIEAEICTDQTEYEMVFRPTDWTMIEKFDLKDDPFSTSKMIATLSTPRFTISESKVTFTNIPKVTGGTWENCYITLQDRYANNSKDFEVKRLVDETEYDHVFCPVEKYCDGDFESFFGFGFGCKNFSTDKIVALKYKPVEF